MKIGEDFTAGDGLWLEAVTSFGGVTYSPLLSVGSNVNFSDNVHVACTNRVSIGDGVLCGSRVLISDHSHGDYVGPSQSSPFTRPVGRRLSDEKTVAIGCNVWIGDGVAILGGAAIGDGSVIGANSVVNRPVPPFCVAVGSPLRVVRLWDSETKSWRRVG